MAEIDDKAPELKTQTPELAAASIVNGSDPIPAFGGLTRDELRFQNNAPITLEKLDDSLYAAVMAGDEVAVRARLGGSDKPLTEAEQVLLIRTRLQEDAIAYSQTQGQQDTRDARKDERAEHAAFLAELAVSAARIALLEGIDAYGGRFDAKHAWYLDRFGGTYDAKGYMAADGSYTTGGGDLYDAVNHTLRLAVGGSSMSLPLELLGYGPEFLKLAIMVAEMRAEARANGAAAAAGMLSATKDDDSWTQALRDRAEKDRAAFARIAGSDDFKAAAASAPGSAVGYSSCPVLTHRDVHKAIEIMKDNVAAGRAPHLMTRYQYKTVMNMADDAEDKLACKLQSGFNRASMGLPKLTLHANDAFAPPVNLSTLASNAFAKPVAPLSAVVANANNNYRTAAKRSAFTAMA